MSHRRQLPTILSDPRTVWFVGLGAVLVFGVAAIPAAADGPVAFFPFNGSTEDASGYGNHAVAMGAVPTEDRFGNPEGAYLVGSFGHLEAPDSDSLDITEAYSVSAWIRQDEMISIFGTIAGKGLNTAYSASVYYGGSYVCPDPAAERRFQVSVGGATGGWTAGPFFDCGTAEWRHVVVTVGTQPGGYHPAALYVDGIYVDTISMMGTFANNTAPLGIGKDGETPYHFAGAIDDLRLYDRELTAGEITELYNSLLIDGFESGSMSSWMHVVP